MNLFTYLSINISLKVLIAIRLLYILNHFPLLLMFSIAFSYLVAIPFHYYHSHHFQLGIFSILSFVNCLVELSLNRYEFSYKLQFMLCGCHISLGISLVSPSCISDLQLLLALLYPLPGLFFQVTI